MPPTIMHQLPSRGRPVTERETGVVSPDRVQRLHCLLKELYAQRSSWRRFLPPQNIPHHDEVRAMLTAMKGVEPLDGAKVLHLDDTSQFNLPFLTQLTLATSRRVERIFYHGESVEELVQMFRERIMRCPKPHLIIIDGVLDMLPPFEKADHVVYGYDVLRKLVPDLQAEGIPALGCSTTYDFRPKFIQAGADGFVRKTIPAESAVEMIAHKYQKALERLRWRRDEQFLMQD